LGLACVSLSAYRIFASRDLIPALFFLAISRFFNAIAFVGEEISRLESDGFSVCRHRVVNSIHAFTTIGEVEASGKVLWIQAEGPLKLNDGGVRLSLFKQSCAL
jgi:hypothetical protein